jgi:hypothetical protein
MPVIAFASLIVEAKHATLIRDIGQSVLEGVSAFFSEVVSQASKSRSLRMRDDSKSAVHA